MVKAEVKDLATEEQRMALIGGPPPESMGRFVSRTPENTDAEPENSALSTEETASVADAPSIQAATSDKSEDPTVAAETAQSEEPKGSGRSRGILLISIGAVIFLLAFAGYRVFSKKGRTGS